VRNPIRGAQFRRDVKLAQKRGKDLAKLREAIRLLIEGVRCRRDIRTTRWPATGSTFATATLNRDWFLIYKTDTDNLHLVRTGTHADLF
jgi:mRNA interferase YafQ